MGLRVVDLFCGCGGMSLGFSRAGFDIAVAMDSWMPALDVYHANMSADVVNMDLTDSALVARVVDAYGPDIVIGGPPCQDFSVAGKRDETAGRAHLTLSYADIVAAVRPRAFVMENVPLSVRSQTYHEAFRRMHDAGYGITVGVLDASLCGCPQARKRSFMVGVLGDPDGSVADSLTEHLAEAPMTVREYMGKAFDFEHYFVMPRNYKRRGIFSVDEPASTVRGMSRPLPGTYRRHPKDTCDPSEVRALDARERACLQTFPKWFRLMGANSAIDQMVGNAVPVNMARYVATVLRSHLDVLDGCAPCDDEILAVTQATFLSDNALDEHGQPRRAVRRHTVAK